MRTSGNFRFIMTQLKHNAATRVSHYANAMGGCSDRRKTGKRYMIKGCNTALSASSVGIWTYTPMCIVGAVKGTRED